MEIAFDDLVHRLERVERENRCLKWAGSLLVLGIASVIFMRHGLSANPPPVPPAPVTAPHKVPAYLEAQGFVMYDEANNKIRAMLVFANDGTPSLRLYGENGKPHAILGIGKGEVPYLWLSDGEGNTRTVLSK